MTVQAPLRRVHRVRHELVRRELQVRRVHAITPHLRAITLGGDALAGFVSASFDDHLKLLLDGPDGQPVRRDYTPRHFDATRQELTLEFALHGHGQASLWAQRAQVGDRVAIAGPRGSMIIPLDYDWHLLAGDATALPAIARRLQKLPAAAQAIVLLQLDSPGDLPPLPSAAQVALQLAPTAQAWLSALAGLRLPAGQGFAWCAGEARVMAQAREVLAQQHGLPREAMRVAAYWKQGAESFHENLESAGL